jgi:mitochondrial fission process protein 1
MSIVPALPYLFDHPVEHAVETVFHEGFRFFGGPEAVGDLPVTGRNELRLAEKKAVATKEKEL